MVKKFPGVLRNSSVWKKISLFLLFFLVLSSLFGVSAGKAPAQAQGTNEPTGFKNVQLWVYPEYDDPRLLIMLEGKIVGATAPAQVRFLVPSGAEMYSAGSMDAQGKYSGGPPNRVQSSIPGWDEISYQVKTDTFRVEYYDPIIIGQPDKKISYDFRWLYPISDLEVTVQVPRTATNFTVSPAGRAFVDSSGVSAYDYTYSGLKEGASPLHFDISYTKSDTRPSLSISGGNSSSPPLVIVIVAVLAVLVGGFFWLRKSKSRRKVVKRQSPQNAVGRVAKASQPQAKFCRQCGQPLSGSAKFCPHCGAKL